MVCWVCRTKQPAQNLENNLVVCVWTNHPVTDAPHNCVVILLDEERSAVRDALTP